MTKKLLAAAVFLLAAGTGAVFAQEAATREEASEQPKSRGVQGGRLGAYFGYNFAGYTDEPLKTANAKLGGVDFGILVDMKYADLLLGLNRDYKEADYLSDDIEIIHGVIGLMGKYPIPIGPRLRIAPEAGFEYQFILLYNGWSRDNVEKLAALLGRRRTRSLRPGLSSTWTTSSSSSGPARII